MNNSGPDLRTYIDVKAAKLNNVYVLYDFKQLTPKK